MASICAAIGLWADFTDVSESTMFLAFIILFACYFSMISHIWRVSTLVKKLSDRISSNPNPMRKKIG